MPDSHELPLEIDVHSVHQLRQQGQPFLLLDCRELDEFTFVRLSGSTHIPMQQIPDRVGELEEFRDQRMIVHCHHGGRSLRVTQWLRKQGFAQVQNMAGGIDAWSLEIDPTLPRY